MVAVKCRSSPKKMLQSPTVYKLKPHGHIEDRALSSRIHPRFLGQYTKSTTIKARVPSMKHIKTSVHLRIQIKATYGFGRNILKSENRLLQYTYVCMWMYVHIYNIWDKKKTRSSMSWFQSQGFKWILVQHSSTNGPKKICSSSPVRKMQIKSKLKHTQLEKLLSKSQTTTAVQKSGRGGTPVPALVVEL